MPGKFLGGLGMNAGLGQTRYELMPQRVKIEVTAIDRINNVLIEEGGDYTLMGFDPAQATALWISNLQFEIIEVDGVPIAPLGNLLSESQQYMLPEDIGGPPLWNGSVMVDLNAFLVANGIDGSATKVNFSIENILETTAIDGGSALIAKKDIGLFFSPNVIPEPGSITVLAMSAMFLSRRRKR